MTGDRLPTTVRMVEDAHDAALVAAACAQVAWRTYQDGLEDGVDDDDLAGLRQEFDRAAAADAYAWSVYHSVRADAGLDEVEARRRNCRHDRLVGYSCLDCGRQVVDVALPAGEVDQ